MAKKKPIAITVSSFYLSSDLYAIKLMSIHLGTGGIYWWNTCKIIYTHTELSKLTPMAIEYSLDNNIPFISGLIQGRRALKHDVYILEKHYGLSLSELIT